MVEDEFAVLLMVEDMLVELGCRVAGSASRLSDAVEQARTLDADAAVLDVNIHNQPVYPVAEVLAARNVPIVFSTGYGTSGMEARWRSYPILQKPYRAEELAAALRQALIDCR